jgi:hypothetical protein
MGKVLVCSGFLSIALRVRVGSLGGVRLRRRRLGRDDLLLFGSHTIPFLPSSVVDHHSFLERVNGLARFGLVELLLLVVGKVEGRGGIRVLFLEDGDEGELF